MTHISVVVPTYNRASLIGQTLSAILAQTRPPDEVIVVDDGSQDDTRSVLAGFGDRVRTLYLTNGGDMIARNVGVRAATHPLVAFCDSDDLWEPGFLAAMAEHWRAEPGMTACYANFRILQEGVLSRRTKFDDAPPDFWSGMRRLGADGGVFDEQISGRLLRFQPFFPSCMMVSKHKFLDAGGWDEGVSRIVGCDFATALRMAVRPPIGVLRSPLVAIRKHGGNISGNTEKMNLGDARVLEHALLTQPELAMLRGEIQRSIVSRRRDAFDSAFARADLAVIHEICKSLPWKELSAKQRLKAFIAALPPHLAKSIIALAQQNGGRPAHDRS